MLSDGGLGGDSHSHLEKGDKLFMLKETEFGVKC